LIFEKPLHHHVCVHSWSAGDDQKGKWPWPQASPTASHSALYCHAR